MLHKNYGFTPPHFSLYAAEHKPNLNNQNNVVNYDSLKKSGAGFTVIEVIVVVAIIGLLASVVLIATSGARKKAHDVKRKMDLAQMGRFLYSSSCYAPNAGAGDYDLSDLVPELTSKYPQLSQFSSLLPKDPKTGSDGKTNYRYIYTVDSHCAVYANFENQDEPTNLGISSVTPLAGQGVFKAAQEGPNGSNIYYQIGK